MKELFFDKLLGIKTRGEQLSFNQSYHYHRYEPTPYDALEYLVDHYELKSSDRIIDFGCGKGRLNFFIHYLLNATVIGIEMNEIFYQEALKNHYQYIKKTKKAMRTFIFTVVLLKSTKSILLIIDFIFLIRFRFRFL